MLTPYNQFADKTFHWKDDSMTNDIIIMKHEACMKILSYVQLLQILMFLWLINNQNVCYARKPHAKIVLLSNIKAWQ